MGQWLATVFVSAPKLLCDKPWRPDLYWNREYKETLKREVESFSPLKNVDIAEVGILLIGQAGAGKSSCINTISSIFANRMAVNACSGTASSSMTTAYRTYPVEKDDGTPLQFRFCDTRGLEERHMINSMDIELILDGHMLSGYEFKKTDPISTKNRKYCKKPKLEEKIHCVVFVIDAVTLNVMSAEVLAYLQEMQKVMNKKNIPQVILLTKVDKLCESVNEELSTIFFSKKIEAVVKIASELLGLPQSHVFPIKNYNIEVQLNDSVDILALSSLRHILNFCKDCMKNFLNESITNGRCE